MGAGNKLQWGGQEVPDLPTLLGLIGSKVTAGAGITRISNGSTGQVELSLNQSFVHSQLSFTGSTNSLRNVTNNSVDELTWGNDALVTAPALAAKQDVLPGVSVSASALNSTRHMFFVGDYQAPSYIMLTCSGSSGNYALLWSSVGMISIRAPTAATLNLFSSAAGPALDIAANANITYHGSLTSASDKRLKTEIEDVSLQSCLSMLSSINMKTYKRLDTPEENRPFRLGVLAQDVQAAIPSDGKFDNLIDTFLHGEEDDNKQEMLSVSYDRLTCVLWTVVKQQQKQLRELTARVALLE